METCRRIPGFEGLLLKPASKNWRHRRTVPWRHIGPLLYELHLRGEPLPPAPVAPVPPAVAALIDHIHQHLVPYFSRPLTEDHATILKSLFDQIALFVRVPPRSTTRRRRP